MMCLHQLLSICRGQRVQCQALPCVAVLKGVLCLEGDGPHAHDRMLLQDRVKLVQQVLSGQGKDNSLADCIAAALKGHPVLLSRVVKRPERTRIEQCIFGGVCAGMNMNTRMRGTAAADGIS